MRKNKLAPKRQIKKQFDLSPVLDRLFVLEKILEKRSNALLRERTIEWIKQVHLVEDGTVSTDWHSLSNESVELLDLHLTRSLKIIKASDRERLSQWGNSLRGRPELIKHCPYLR